MSTAPGDDARAKTAELVAGLSPREQIDLLAQALLREHMHRCGFKRTLKAFDTECPRDARTIASRAVMRQMLNIPPEGRLSRLQRIRAHCTSETDSKAAPVAPTFMEELCSYRLTKREHLLRSQGTDNTCATQNEKEEEEEDDVDSEAELAELREKAAARQKLCREAEAMIEEGRQLAARKAERRRKRANKDNASGAEKNDEDADDASNDSSKEQSSHHHHHSHKKDKQGKAKKGTGRKHRKQRQSESNAFDDEATKRVGELEDEEEEPTFLTGVTWHDNSDDDEENDGGNAAAKALLTVRAVGSGWQPPQSSSSVASTTATAAAAAISLRGAPLPVPDTAITSATTLAPTVSLRDAPAVPRHSLSSTSLHDPSTTSAATKDSTTASAIDSVDEIFAPSETQATIKDIREELRRTSGNASLARSPPATQSTTSSNSYLDPFARPRTSLTGLGTTTTSSTGMMTSPHAAPLVIPERQEILKVWQPSTHTSSTNAVSGSRPGMFRPASFGGSGGLTSSVKPVNSSNVAAGVARPFVAPATSSILMHNVHSGLTASMSGSAATHAQDSSMESEATTPPAKTASLYSYDSAAQPCSSALVSRGGGAGGALRTLTSTTTGEGAGTSGAGAASALQAKRQGVGFHTATAGDESGDKEKRRKRKVTLLVD